MNKAEIDKDNILLELKALFFICNIKEDLAIELIEERDSDNLIIRVSGTFNKVNEFVLDVKLNGNSHVFLKLVSGNCSKEDLDRVIDVVKCWANSLE